MDKFNSLFESDIKDFGPCIGIDNEIHIHQEWPHLLHLFGLRLRTFPTVGQFKYDGRLKPFMSENEFDGLLRDLESTTNQEIYRTILQVGRIAFVVNLIALCLFLAMITSKHIILSYISIGLAGLCVSIRTAKIIETYNQRYKDKGLVFEFKAINCVKDHESNAFIIRLPLNPVDFQGSVELSHISDQDYYSDRSPLINKY
ncbi:hypothetical protein PPL_01490 [Heterostelium album PN500]|uniref:Uncharacterized protein n=1 Tax=Heterostelium pallidum (strain ATCC 26659 / Pp 5 / PN500) TaxID=670386 RepID=D3AZE9_HETP5|nr:hypothetical protein PPL_01490 [Heterostelium album PN500]EFA85532.1 hypothetical protein PPL_01490 [Heterostelium album PN500]|eukprot:XP_020437640.1 hypothetical protein PPL_01490 [Heterostelium album PN500]